MADLPGKSRNTKGMVQGHMDKIIINFTPTGMFPGKKDSPFVPISSREIIEDVKAACKLGITMVHLHARDENSGEPCYKKEKYAEIIAGIRKFSEDLVICVSTSGPAFPEASKRTDILSLDGDLKPDMASLTLSSFNFNKQASLNPPETILQLLHEMNMRDIKPELEAFDSGMINYAKYLIKKGLLTPPHYMNLILGNIACAQADLLHLSVMINDLPEDCLCSIGGMGANQIVMNSLAIAMGLGVRTGLEDNLWYDSKRTKLAKNIDLLERVHMLIHANEKELMHPAELRNRLHLRGKR
ncbi:MAG: 3-keto-5-aminohexanoate cleavage protein [Eubacteriales bacterium]|nr:3-keto-5-aminohexanoate cleavage protein [Eubacteriales bacterium]